MTKYTIHADNPVTGAEEPLMEGVFETEEIALKALGKELVRGFRKVGLVPTTPRPQTYRLVNEEDGTDSYYAVVVAVDLNVMGRALDGPPEDHEGTKVTRSGRKSKAPPSLADMLGEGKELPSPEALPDYSETFSAQDMGNVEFEEEGETALQEELDEEEAANPAREPSEREEREAEAKEQDEEILEIREEEGEIL